MEKEFKFYKNVVEFLVTDDRFKEIAKDAPSFYKHIRSFEAKIQQRLDVANWEPNLPLEVRKYSRDELTSIYKVIRIKN